MSTPPYLCIVDDHAVARHGPKKMATCPTCGQSITNQCPDCAHQAALRAATSGILTDEVPGASDLLTNP
jgi:primosomal protein N'